MYDVKIDILKDILKFWIQLNSCQKVASEK